MAEWKGPGAAPVRLAAELVPAWLGAAPEPVEVLLFAGGCLQGAKVEHCPGQRVLQLMGE